MTKDIYSRKREFIRLFEESGWSQADAARELDMTRGGVNGIITGDTEPSAALLKFFKLVLLSKGHAGKMTEETFTEQWFNDLLFELKALPEPQREHLVQAFRQIVKQFPVAKATYPPSSRRPLSEAQAIAKRAGERSAAGSKKESAP